MVTFVRNEHGDTGSNPSQDCLHFTQSKYTWEGYESNYSPSNYEQIVGQTGFFTFGMATGLREGKLLIHIG